jgi:tRNA threonylcarbamoyl adenosine modification protein (Sua5/YciO/YrdC/YwlC family)
MHLLVHEDTPNKRHIALCLYALREGGIIVYPTDTVYSYGCSLESYKSVEKIRRAKNRDKTHYFSIVLNSIAEINTYARNVSNSAYKIIKKLTPGPYTFILHSSKVVPKLLQSKQKTIGIRIPDNHFARQLVEELGMPIISTSVDTAEGEYTIDLEDTKETLLKVADIICDAGQKESDLSTVVDLTGDEPVVLRQGKGPVFF